jgi:hypothetical protein
MDLGDRADRFKVLIRDRVGQFTSALDPVLADAGITVCNTWPSPPRRGRSPTIPPSRSPAGTSCAGAPPPNSTRRCGFTTACSG